MTKLLGNQSVWTKIVLLLGANVILMAGSSLTVAMPAMMTEFATVPGVTFWVSMVITLPALFVVIGGPITGLLTDRLGRKPVLVISILLGGISGSAGYVLNTIGPILVTRALVGLSIAGATTSTNALIGDYFAGQERAKFMGLLSAFAGLGAVVFLPIGGILAGINWHYVFLTYLPLLLLFPLVWIFITEPEIVVF
jgi:MFS family permease